uniref:Opioid growth factor receptor-like n=1 Tax=Petromyzon marinus TaxID=7757 RepID=A0AAJ7U4U6_PETMA|nr:opioid growth factor receptor-like [Petromyzon marinus]
MLRRSRVNVRPNVSRKGEPGGCPPHGPEVPGQVGGEGPAEAPIRPAGSDSRTPAKDWAEKPCALPSRLPGPAVPPAGPCSTSLPSLCSLGDPGGCTATEGDVSSTAAPLGGSSGREEDYAGHGKPVGPSPAPVSSQNAAVRSQNAPGRRSRPLVQPKLGARRAGSVRAMPVEAEAASAAPPEETTAAEKSVSPKTPGKLQPNCAGKNGHSYLGFEDSSYAGVWNSASRF